MVSPPRENYERLLTDRAQLKRLALEINRQIGLEFDPEATADKARERILADGIDPDDNRFSCGIIAARDEE